jgi:hypothetical protein
MNTTPTEQEFPAYLYIYREDGTHDGKIRVPDKTTMTRLFNELVIPAVKAGRQVIVTDALDFCTFHAEGGEVIFPTPEIIAKMTKS